MNAIPADVPFVWIALLVVSASVLGVVSSLPGAPPPDAERVGDAIDEVGATDHAATATIPIDASEIRVKPDRIALRNGGCNAHADLHYGPVVPVEPGGALAPVLQGTPPAEVFESPAGFRAAIGSAQSDRHTWRTAPDELQIRRVQYGEVTGVLVG